MGHTQTLWFGPVSGHPGVGQVPEREGDRQSRTSQRGEVDSRSQRLPGLMADRCWPVSTRVVILEIVTPHTAIIFSVQNNITFIITQQDISKRPSPDYKAFDKLWC